MSAQLCIGQSLYTCTLESDRTKLFLIAKPTLVPGGNADDVTLLNKLWSHPDGRLCDLCSKSSSMPGFYPGLGLCTLRPQGFTAWFIATVWHHDNWDISKVKTCGHVTLSAQASFLYEKWKQLVPFHWWCHPWFWCRTGLLCLLDTRLAFSMVVLPSSQTSEVKKSDSYRGCVFPHQVKHKL